MRKLFTKSRFKTALECPTKLYYASHEESYANGKIDDPFLKALAKGGFQVGALAQCYYPEGIEVKHKDYENALKETNELLQKENVVIFEAAIKFNNLFVRVDILEKKGQVINLIEVKSKSADPSTFSDELWAKRELKAGIYKLKSTWQEYLYDIAFQAHVVKLSFPQFTINSFLMCADKSKTTTVDGLNQKFLLKNNGTSTTVEIIGDVSPASLGLEVLCKLDVNEVVEIIHQEKEMSERLDGRGFAEGIKYLAESFQNDIKIPPQVGTKCKKCEFRSIEPNKSSGFNECWKQCVGLSDEELKKPFAFDVWFFNATEALDDGNILIEDLDASYFDLSRSANGLSRGKRQWLQVEKYQEQDFSSYIDLVGLAQEMNKLTYPLHMIDFETCMVAIPFSKGRKPYEQIAFQFSHHTISEDGVVTHADEYLNSKPGEFPNFEFVRALKKALTKDKGSIFRYSAHENTVLCQIRTQLQESQELDKEELIEFIETITCKKPDWEGERNMVDLLDWVKKYYYNPAMGSSNSIKYVLPAILNESEFLKTKYSQANYHSKNFNSHQWIHFNTDGSVIDPYKSLPPIMDQYDYEALEFAFADEEAEIKDGGAALTAYALMQFTQMSTAERNKIQKALLRYCELDTLAMVMIFEHWKNHLLSSR